MRFAHFLAELKDPTPSRPPPQRIFPRRAHAPRPRHRLRRRIPRPTPEDLGPANPPDPDRIESQKGRLPPRSSPRTYIDQHQCNSPTEPKPWPPSLSSQADVVTLRAVEHFETILPQAVTFLAPKGTLALLIATPQIPHLTTLTNLKWHATMHVPKSHSRVLLLGYKV